MIISQRSTPTGKLCQLDKRVRIAFEIEELHDALVAKNQGVF